MRWMSVWAVVVGMIFVATATAADERPIKLLFLGDNGAHRPADRFRQLQPVLAKRGIVLEYTDSAKLLEAKMLAAYDGLVIYANTTRIEPEQEKALLEFVEGGKGFIPLHCASYCFLNSPKYVALVGAQFRRHGTGIFRTTAAAPDHPVMKGFKGFESWDETYVHTRHNDEGRTVLEYRVERDAKEPWTWVRTQGKGRVFYTAWGHDHRTWGHPGFHELVERGIRWAIGRDPSVVPPAKEVATETAPANATTATFPVPAMTPLPKNLKPFEYVDVGRNIPNYTPGRQWGTQGEPRSQQQLPLPPDESLKHLAVPQGFRAELFASEANLPGGKPIAMNWDERGRLWIALTVDYPHDLARNGEGRDRLVIVEDTDGDGRADKSTVFAEKLNMPTSIAFHRGGAIVQNGTQTLYLKDTDGDDRADERRVMFSGWNMRDTHGGVSNFQFGLDNWIWAMQGYNYSRPTSVALAEPGVALAVPVTRERSQGFAQGFWRFRPDGSKIEFIRSSNNNTWGLGISEEGIIFGSTANRNPSMYMPIANRYYEKVRGWRRSLVLGTIADTYLFQAITDRVRQVDQHGGYTAAAGHSLYTARAYPQEYWNRVAFVAEPTGHLVGTFVLDRRGADFRSTSPFNLLASDDEWTSPIMAEVGPDGHVWVIDWYNFIVQHNPTPIGFRTGPYAAYQTDLRDKKHGRIYRVVYGAASKTEPVSLAGAPPEKLVQALKHPTLLWRRHAQRLLVERGEKDIVPKLIDLVRDDGVDAIGLNVGAIHALWTLHGLGALDGGHSQAMAAAFGALRHKSTGVRRNAIQVLPPAAESVKALLTAGLMTDHDAQVRLAAILALADLPAVSEAGKALAELIAAPDVVGDPWLADALTSAAANNAEHFLAAVAARSVNGDRGAEILGVVAEHYARGAPADSAPRLLAALAAADPQTADTIVRALSRGWPKDRPLAVDDQAAEHIEKLAGRLPAGSRGLLIKLAATWGSKRFEQHAAKARDDLMRLLRDTERPDAERIAAAGELAAFGQRDGKVVEELLEAITPQASPQLATGILRALEVSEAAELARLVAARLPNYTPVVRAAGISLLLGRSESTRTLLDAIDKGTVGISDLSLDQRQALSSHPEERIRRRAQAVLRRSGALPNADRQKVLTDWLAVTKTKGDVALGKEVFKKQCAKCHTHNGEGEHIGPDLTGMAVHPKEELLGHILDPSKSVEGNYRIYKVVTSDGQVISGLLASESKTTLELFDAEGKKRTLLREEVDQIVASSNSLMPDGFEKLVSREDMAHLLEFLAARGKYLPLDLAKIATTTSVRGMFYSAEAAAERLIFPDWKLKQFRGVPFLLVDPQEGRVANVVLLYGPQGTLPPKMPRRVELPCKSPAKAIHMLSGVAGWGFPYSQRGSVTMIVRLHYADGSTEDHELKNGEHFADYIRRVDVPSSEFAFALRSQQVRYLAVRPKRQDTIDRIELVKGPDATAPVVMAVTLEGLN
jgi:putative membrane-bound dehydrogenase-like protein